MKKIIIGALMIATMIQSPVKALTEIEAQVVGREVGKNICSLVWSDQTSRGIMLEAILITIEDNYWKERIEKINNIVKEYGENHNIYQNYEIGVRDQIMETCQNEYLESTKIEGV